MQSAEELSGAFRSKSLENQIDALLEWKFVLESPVRGVAASQDQGRDILRRQAKHNLVSSSHAYTTCTILTAFY